MKNLLVIISVLFVTSILSGCGDKSSQRKSNNGVKLSDDYWTKNQFKDKSTKKSKNISNLSIKK